MDSFVDVTVTIDAKPVLVRSDRVYAQAISQAGGFEPGLVKAIKALAQGSKVALDVGANIGCTTLLLSSISQKVFSFEPAQSTFGLLLHNTRDCENVSLHNIALGDTPSHARIRFAPDNRSGGFISDTASSKGHAIEDVIVKTLDQFVTENDLSDIDFIKIDTEGYEGHVLRGAADTLQRFKPNVLGEVNHWCLNVFQRTSIPDFFDQLRSIFPILFAVDHATGRIADLHDGDRAFIVMHGHIIKGGWPDFIGAFDEARLQTLRQTYQMF